MSRLPDSVTKAISAIEKLPGIGPKSATRLIFYLLNTPNEFVLNLAKSLVDLKKNTLICKNCFSVSDKDICSVCDDNKRKKELICVVERSIDMINIERAGIFDGVYHVLGGVINPLEHIGPDDLKIDELIARLKSLVGQDKNGIEVILATGLTMEGEATALYIKSRINKSGLDGKVLINRIGMGIPIGSDLSYVDEATLSRAMESKRKL